MINIIVALFCLAIIPTASIAQKTGQEKPEGKLYPHGRQGNCQICHVESEESLNSWFTFGSSKRKLKTDYNSICRQCHGVDFGHGIGKIPEMNREDLPMDQEGRIACAITCHNMHIQADDSLQNRFHLRYSYTRLCTSCHNK